MKNPFNLIILTLLISLNSLAFEQIDANVPANEQHEECFYLDTETVINYQYNTSSPLDFNLHYHDDNGMTFLVELPNSSASNKSVKQLSNKQVYCLMWVNSTSTTAELSYEFTLEK